jgi:hypothetical protein
MRADASTFARGEQFLDTGVKAFSRPLAYNQAINPARNQACVMRLDQYQRDSILQEMGIQTYVPRQPLPGARASVPSEQRQSAPKETRPAAPAAVLPRSPEPVCVPGVSTSPAMSQKAVPAPMAAVPEEAARFAFAYIPVNEHLSVINELPWARSAALSPSCRQLLADMLKALGVPCEPAQLNPMVFTWPLSDAGDMPVDSESARHMLEGFLSRRLKLRPVPYLMVLAEQSAEFLFPAQAVWHFNGDALMQHPRLTVEMVITHSLNAMEAVRELKRPAWQALQPLKLALASNRLTDGESRA